MVNYNLIDSNKELERNPEPINKLNIQVIKRLRDTKVGKSAAKARRFIVNFNKQDDLALYLGEYADDND